MASMHREAIAWPVSQCKRHCYTVLYNMCILLLSTCYTHVIRFSITLRIETLYTGVYNMECITLCIFMYNIVYIYV